MNLIRLYSS